MTPVGHCYFSVIGRTDRQSAACQSAAVLVSMMCWRWLTVTWRQAHPGALARHPIHAERPQKGCRKVASGLHGSLRFGRSSVALFGIMCKSLSRAMLGSLLVVAAMTQTGCWSPPVSDVQPKGEPRLIQGAIAVKSVKPSATLQSVNPDALAITLLGAGDSRPVSYRVSPKVGKLNRLKAGDRVQATVLEELTVYVSREGQPPDTDDLPRDVDARVLSVDRSYRLLTLRYPNGPDETFKVTTQVRLDKMEAGDAVSIRPIEAIALR